MRMRGLSLKRGAHRVAVAAMLVAVGATSVVTASVMSSTQGSPAFAATSTPSSGQQVEAQQFFGSWTQVSDTQATNGTAVMITSPVNQGALWSTSSLPAGTYLMSVRVRSVGARILLGVDNKTVGSSMVAGAWQVVTVPVRLQAGSGYALMPVSRTDGGANNPVYVDWFSLTPTTVGYTTAGTDILDPSGRKVIPRGVNRDGFEFTHQGDYWITDNDFEAMRLWGVAFVRLPLGEQYWLTSSCAYDATYAGKIDAAVQSITKRGMIALIDLHTTFAGQSCGTGQLAPMADDYSVTFWSQVAARYKDNPLVAFDLYNEPDGINDQVWHDGGTVTTTGTSGTVGTGGTVGTPGTTYHAVGMQQLYDTVRATGASNLIFISGESKAYNIDVALRRPVDGYGIVYGTHLYRAPGTGPLPATIDSVVPPVAARYPVMVTEFGTVSGTAAYNANVINYAESHGIGWAAWVWYQLPGQYALLQSFYTYAPSPAGQPVRDALWKAKGWTTWGH